MKYLVQEEDNSNTRDNCHTVGQAEQSQTGISRPQLTSKLRDKFPGKKKINLQEYWEFFPPTHPFCFEGERKELLRSNNFV